MIVPSLLAAVALALVHLFAGKMRFLQGIPRSRWLSIAGGASVAYVFLHLLPELAAGQQVVAENLGQTLAFLEHHIYLLALIGLATFYGLERMVRTTRHQPSEERPGEERVDSEGTFWIHIGSFTVYNTLIGYLLLHRLESGIGMLLLFTLAMGLHFLVNDYGLNEHHEEAYKHRGRWIVAGAVLLGWLVGLLGELPELAISLLIAFLAGGVILNVLKEELPEERQSRFWAFALGLVVYAALLLHNLGGS